MAAEGTKKESNPEAEAKNWEQRLRSEQEAPHKWNENWGSLFNNGVPHAYDARIEHYKEILKSKPNLKVPSKYGVGAGFREPSICDRRRRKLLQENPLDYED